jgi:hypothetical protein
MSQLTANEILQELEKAQTAEQLNLLLQSIPSKCYEKCIDKPMRSLSSSEQVLLNFVIIEMCLILC